MLKNISAIFTALIGINYFYSFWIIHKVLDRAGVSTFSIFSVQDLLLPLAGINLYIIILCGILCLVVVGIKYFITNTKIRSFMINPITSIKLIGQTPKKWNQPGFKKEITKASLTLLAYLAVIALSVYMLRLYHRHELLDLKIICFLVGFLIVMIWLEKYYRKASDVFLIGLAFLGWSILNESVKESKDTSPNENRQTRFIYSGDTITSDHHNKLVFYGSSYLVMYNDSTKETALFETANVSHFTQRNSMDPPKHSLKKQK